MNKVYVVFAREKSNPFAARVVVGMTDTYGSARRMVSLNEDSFVDCVIQEWDIATMQDLNKKVPWSITLWKNLEDVSVRRVHLSDNPKAKSENKLFANNCDNSAFLIWAESKEEAIEEARGMLNEGSN